MTSSRMLMPYKTHKNETKIKEKLYYEVYYNSTIEAWVKSKFLWNDVSLNFRCTFFLSIQHSLHQVHFS